MRWEESISEDLAGYWGRKGTGNGAGEMASSRGWARNTAGLGLAECVRNKRVTTSGTVGGKIPCFLSFILGFPTAEPHTLRSVHSQVCLFA